MLTHELHPMYNSAFFFSGGLIYWNSEGHMYEPYLENLVSLYNLCRFLAIVGFCRILFSLVNVRKGLQ